MKKVSFFLKKNAKNIWSIQKKAVILHPLSLKKAYLLIETEVRLQRQSLFLEFSLKD